MQSDETFLEEIGNVIAKIIIPAIPLLVLIYKTIKYFLDRNMLKKKNGEKYFEECFETVCMPIDKILLLPSRIRATDIESVIEVITQIQKIFNEFRKNVSPVLLANLNILYNYIILYQNAPNERIRQARGEKLIYEYTNFYVLIKRFENYVRKRLGYLHRTFYNSFYFSYQHPRMQLLILVGFVVVFTSVYWVLITRNHSLLAIVWASFTSTALGVINFCRRKLMNAGGFKAWFYLQLEKTNFFKLQK